MCTHASDLSLALKTERITVGYRGRRVIEGVSLNVRRGDIYAILGPNGAGKTTLLRVLLGLMRPSVGAVEVLGAQLPQGLPQVFSRIGSLIGEPSVYEHLTGVENVAIAAKLRGASRSCIGDVLRLVGLFRSAEDLVSRYSQGMRQRLGMAIALVGDPELLLLDEPTNGFDPAAVREFWGLLMERRGQATVLVSSHRLDEVEAIASRIGVLSHGSLVFEGTMAELSEQPRCELRVGEASVSMALGILRTGGYASHYIGNRIVVEIAGWDDVANVNRLLVEARISVYGLDRLHKSLEETYLELTDSSLREDSRSDISPHCRGNA